MVTLLWLELVVMLKMVLILSPLPRVLQYGTTSWPIKVIWVLEHGIFIIVIEFIPRAVNVTQGLGQWLVALRLPVSLLGLRLAAILEGMLGTTPAH